jgi:hypothetical protein
VVASHLVLQRAWDFWKGIAESSMGQSSQHGLHSMVQYRIELLLVSVYSSCVVLCSVDKSEMFGQLLYVMRQGLPMEMLFNCLDGSSFAGMS